MRASHHRLLQFLLKQTVSSVRRRRNLLPQQKKEIVPVSAQVLWIISSALVVTFNTFWFFKISSTGRVEQYYA